MVPRMRDRLGHLDDFQRFSGTETSFGRGAYRPMDRERAEPGAETDFLDLGRNYKDMADTIAKAANTINELVKRSQALRADAEAAISAARVEAQSEKERADKLQATLDAALAERSRIVQDQERRIRELHADKQEVADQLEKVTADLDLANQWLEYLTSHVHSQLSDTIKKAELVVRNRNAA